MTDRKRQYERVIGTVEKNTSGQRRDGKQPPMIRRPHLLGILSRQGTEKHLAAAKRAVRAAVEHDDLLVVGDWARRTSYCLRETDAVLDVIDYHVDLSEPHQETVARCNQALTELRQARDAGQEVRA